MKFNPQLKNEIQKFYDYAIVVEGKKDVFAMQELGFKNVYAIHEIGVPIKERVLKLSEEIGRKQKICILTDFDKKGKTLYFSLKTLFAEQGMKLDSTLRGLLLVGGLSHVEGIGRFINTAEGRQHAKKKHWERR